MCSESNDPRHFTRFRHRWEMPMIWLSAFITIVALFAGVGVMVVDVDGGLDQMVGTDNATMLRDWSGVAILLLAAPIFIYIYRFYLIAGEKAGAIRVGPNQFPELWALYQDLGQRLDMHPLPRLYVANGNGVVNAFALECNRRNRYIVMHAEIVMLLPVGQATTRAQEYSADRLAMAVCPNHANSLRLLSIGPWLVNNVDPEAWLEQAEQEHREWMIRAAQAMSSHAVGIKRYKALRDIEKHGFSVHGEMF